MGNFVNNDPHDPRSSSKSLAMRWKHENVRVVSVIAVVAIAITLVSVLVGFSYSKKTVAIVVDGQERRLETRQETLRDVLDEHTIAVGSHDEVSVALDTEVKDGAQITIERAKPIQITVDGLTKTLYTTKDNVKQALTQLNINLKAQDKIFPSKLTSIASNMNIKVVRVTKGVEERKVKVPYQVVKQANPDMKKGTKKTVQQGQSGLVVQKIEKTFEDGKLVTARMVDKKVQTKQVNKVIAYGTKKEPELVVLSADSDDVGQSSGGNSDFDYKKKITNVQLTAYTETPGSVGAKTASGTKVTEGRTIAVDPKVIPLGWWVYIEGIGFRRAEDTGGAVKGNIIDVYYDSSKQVQRFGRKKGYTVYVIGPVKPEAS
ncbi:3D domain-containing protein [Paenibacillus sp. UMB4589-SE434]|uniref:3D domain-containing protein n=1 Tax=Paenibacillus sp. UMB4589-SE434 TaxID=3046314 RepID=UPI00254AD091|nr:3D domain-containing protein [Paenibacillus sp. UMB4589-SE434]MDK8184083.1 ubiquitin-like domain-containing protein [Paenibacillus sp. UMB4589-SE434]